MVDKDAARCCVAPTCIAGLHVTASVDTLPCVCGAVAAGVVVAGSVRSETFVVEFTRAGWRSVSFTKSYTSAVAVCTPVYSSDSDNFYARLRDVGPRSMSIAAVAPNAAQSFVAKATFYCLVVEEGTLLAPLPQRWHRCR